MTVLEGEGRVSILYGFQPLPASPYPSVYLARPDVEGRHPGVIVVRGAISSSSKSVCRRLARYGYAAVAPETTDLEAAVSALQDGWTEWAAGRVAVLGIGEVAGAAQALASRHDAPLIVLGGTESIDAEALSGGSHPVLGLVAGAPDGVAALYDAAGRGQWVRYGDVGPGFHDENSPDFAAKPAEDAYERMIAFLDRHLAPVSLSG